MTETELAAKITKELRDVYGFYVMKIVGNKYQASGLPDVLLIKEGEYTFIEWKGEKTKLTPIQKHTHMLLRKFGAVVHLVRFVSPTMWRFNDEELELKSLGDGIFRLVNAIVHAQKQT